VGDLEQEASEAPGGSSAAASAGASAGRRTRLQTAIANIWKEILGVDDVDGEADFFELGGDSLAAVRMLAAVDDLLLAQISFIDFLDGPTVDALAGAVLDAREAPAATDPVPVASGATDEGPAPGHPPASFAQERLWFLQQLEGATDAYNMPIGARLRRPIDADALERALQEIVRRHAALRTTFAAEDGHAVQVVAGEGRVALEQVDLRGEPDPEAEAQRLVDVLTGAPLELDQGPLMRALLARIGDEEYVLELVFHHIVCDGWSHVVVLRELGTLYEAHARGEQPSLSDPRIQYPDYAVAQRARLEGAALDAAVDPWLERLAGAPVALDLPTDRPRPQLPSYRGATYRMRLPSALSAAVRSFARSARATPFATLLAAYYVLLHRHSGQEDIVIGATTSGRERPELEDGVGLFASTVALRADLAGDPSFAELAAQVRHVVLWAVAHENAPFEQIVARLGLERDLSRHPVFQVFVAHVPRAPLTLDGAEPFDARPATSRFDLTLFVEEEAGDELELAWEYSTDLFDATTVERFGRHYLRLLEAAIADPARPIGELPLLDEAERRAATGAGGGAEYPVTCMHERFEQHAAAHPDAVALRYEGESVSYGELNERANRLARHLRALGAGPEQLVALFLEPSPQMLTAVLGVLKSGAAYVPLDPEYPAERVGFVLEDTGAPLLITEERLLERLPRHGARTVCLDRDREVLDPLADTNPEPLATPENLAYVIYTSGSTGRPKGVQVEHRQVARLFSATDAWYGFGPEDTWVLLHSYAFDFSVWEIWGALAYGGTLVISPLWTTRSPQALAELVAGQRVTVLNATPSLFVVVQDELLRAGELMLRYVVFGGEALQPAALRPWYEHFGAAGATLVNMYGITETTVHVTYRPLEATDCDSETSPIGVPIPDLSLHLLDPKGVPVPDGVAGELFVGGAGVARGYLNRPELSAERFIANPFGPGRLYRTGDVARRLPGGELDFRGRIDDQVKIRGFRIELGEILVAIREVPGVADGAVVAVDAAPGDTRLAAYVVPDGGAWSAAAERIRDRISAHLEHKLPGYMVPASLILLDRLPLTRNGKTDRKALPAPDWEQAAGELFLAPRTETEQAIAEIWATVLGVERVGAEDNFFNLGGHSLLAARVVTQVRKRFEISLSVRALFESPALAAFAAHVDGVRGVETAAAPPDPVLEAVETPAGAEHGVNPLSFPQQQLLFFDELSPGSITYNAALAIRADGELDPGLLRQALRAVFQRHEALRTVLVWGEATPHQVVLADSEVELALVDLSSVPEPERSAELERMMREHARRPFDLSRELMLRTTLFRLGPAEHVILFQPHHVAFDAWAVEVLYRDLGEIYNALLHGRDPDLPELPLQYRDFARWQRERLQGELLDRELDFWRAQLAGAPTVLRLPTDKRRPPEQTFEGASLTVDLDAELAEAVRELSAAEQATPYMLLLAAFATLLYRRSGQDDILFGGPMANRDRPGLEHLIGFFANTIVVRAKLGGNPAFLDLLRTVRESVLASYEHQEVPLELVVDAVRPQRDPGVNPLFQINFRVRVGPAPSLELERTTTTHVPVDLGLARFDLALELHLLDDRLEAEFNWNTALFEQATIARLATDFERLLRAAVADPSTRLLSFELGEDPAPAGAPPERRGIRRYREGSGSRG
jgi:amino acid adenylation domain-containing protein